MWAVAFDNALALPLPRVSDAATARPMLGMQVQELEAAPAVHSARARLDSILTQRPVSATMRQAIEEHAALAPDRERYLDAVADALIEGGALDLEAIVHDCRSVARVYATAREQGASSATTDAAPARGTSSTTRHVSGQSETGVRTEGAVHAGVHRRPDASLPSGAKDASALETTAAPAGEEPAALPNRKEETGAARLPRPRPAESPSRPVNANVSGDPGVAQGERLALINAGLVLAAPYLPRLFNVLGLVQEGGFRDTGAAERGVHLLQYLACAEAGAPEYQLVLNKLLCGLPLDAPVPAAIELGDGERDTIVGLLKAMVAAWSALGNTSVDGLRQSFLMREGEMWFDGESWQLSVKPGPFDMLMDRLPWSFSIIKFPWMALPLHVSWH
jgi:hypothetical protein